MSPDLKRGVVVFALAFTLFAAGVHPGIFAAGNDTSRWAQIESLADFGSTTIERSRFSGTVDRVEVDGRIYSNKQPFLGMVGAACYLPLRWVTGWRLGDPARATGAIVALVLLLVALPAAAMTAQFDWLLGRLATIDPGWRGAATAGLAAGTLVMSYSGTINQHVPAAALLVVALAATLERRALRAGIFCGLAGAVDLLPGFGMAPFFAWALLAPGAGDPAGRSRAARFAAGVGGGLLLVLLSNLATTGSLLPPKLLAGAIDRSNAVGPSLGGVVLPQTALYPLEILFGAHGLLTVSPILVVGIWGLLRASRHAPGRTSLRSDTLPGHRPQFWRAVGAGIVVQFVGHALVAGSYGGWAYGFRYLLPMQPLVLLAVGFAFERRAARVLFATLLWPSVLFALLGAYHPWPPAFEQASRIDPIAAQVSNPIGGNAAALLAARAPGSGLATAVARRFVDGDEAARRRYFRYFFATRGDLVTMRKFEPRRP